MRMRVFCISLLNKFSCTHVLKYKLTPVILWKPTTAVANSANYTKKAIFCINWQIYPSKKKFYAGAAADAGDKFHVSVWMAPTKRVDSHQVILNGGGWDRKWMIRSAASPATKSPSGWISSSIEGTGGAWGIISYRRVDFPLLSCPLPLLLLLPPPSPP